MCIIYHFIAVQEINLFLVSTWLIQYKKILTSSIENFVYFDVIISGAYANLYNESMYAAGKWERAMGPKWLKSCSVARQVHLYFMSRLLAGGVCNERSLAGGAPSVIAESRRGLVAAFWWFVSSSWSRTFTLPTRLEGFTRLTRHFLKSEHSSYPANEASRIGGTETV